MLSAGLYILSEEESTQIFYSLLIVVFINCCGVFFMYYRDKYKIMTSSPLLSHLSNHQFVLFLCHRYNTLHRGPSRVPVNLCSPGPQCPARVAPWRPEAVIAVALRVPSAAPGRPVRSAQARSNVAWAWLRPRVSGACSCALSVGCRARSGPPASRAPLEGQSGQKLSSAPVW